MSSPRPNVLLITCDQLRKDSLGCYGQTAIETPHLDRLAATGTLYNRAYTVSPWCLPSRSSLVTGRYPHNHRAYSNFRPASLPPDVPNLYQRLGAAGYGTSHVGKCHYAPVPYGSTRPDETQDYRDFRAHYLSLGMDHLDLQDDKQVSVWFRDDYAEELDKAGLLAAYRAAVWDDGNQKVFTFPGPTEWHPDSWVARKAGERISRVSTADPQFLWVSFSGPHFPFDPPTEYLDRVDASRIPGVTDASAELADPSRVLHRAFHGPTAEIESGVNSRYSAEYWRRLRHHYLANVALLDDRIGEVLAAAYERFDDDILVIFTTDHGEMLGNHGVWGKGDCAYEDVLNVPFLMRPPGDGDVGDVGARARSEALVMTVDVFPTVLECAGITHGNSDGRSLLADDAGHPFTVAEGEGFVCISDGRCKMVRITRPEQDFLELFDLARDPHERDNLANHPDYAGKLAELLRTGMDLFVGDVLP